MSTTGRGSARRLVAALIVGLVIGLAVGGVVLGTILAPKPSGPGEKAVKLKLTLRELWIDHAFWARTAVLAAKAGDTGAFNIAWQRLVDNAKAVSNAISPLYGQRAADQLLSLLSDHANAVRDYAVAVYTKNEAGKQSATSRLRQNADQIASFLNGANPTNWPKATLQAVLTGHIGAHMAQVDAIAAGDWPREADVWKSMVDNVSTIADALADGIVKQFPDRFLLVCGCCCHN